MSIVATAAAVALAAMCVVAVYNLLTAPRLERAGEPGRFPLVSVLVPARNEGATLTRTLPALLALDYPRLELVLLDDGSEDDTEEVVSVLAGERVRLLRGSPTPAGWTGKNWACHQLAAAARGEVLLFCDADVAPRPEAVRQTVALLQATGAGSATAMPRHRLGSWVEHAVVPLVAQLPVVATLPLRLVVHSPAPSLSMANGQWLAFTRDAYRGCGGHAAVAGQVLEDVALGRRVKAAGIGLVAALGTRSLTVRMYQDAAAVRAGFRKNLFALLGGRSLPFVAGVAGFLLVAVYPWAAALAGSRDALLPLALLVALRGLGALFFGHGARSVLLHPAGALLAVAIALDSFVGHRRGTLRWKGRRLVPPGGRSPVQVFRLVGRPTHGSSPPTRGSMQDEREQVIVVDASDAELGAADKLPVHREGILHRAFSVFVLNGRGQILLQRRADGKYHCGGLWSNTCCGHPRPGEETAGAARRRLQEEMGIDCDLTRVFSFTYRAELGNGLSEHEIDHVFAGRYDDDPEPDPAEVGEWRWLDATALRREMEHDPSAFTPWLAEALRGLLAHPLPHGSLGAS